MNINIHKESAVQSTYCKYNSYIMKITYIVIVLIISTLIDVIFHEKDSLAKGLSEKKALLIANYKYKKKGYSLRTPRQDVKELKKLLHKSGFQVTVRFNLNADEMDEVITRFSDELTENSVGYIHYAGHGIELHKESLILGINFSAKSSTRAKKQGIQVDVLIESVQKAGLGVVVIDACRNNPFLTKRGKKRGLGVGASVSKPIDMGPNRGVILVYSTSEGETADEGEKVSPFVKSMQKAYQSHAESPLTIFFNNGVQNSLSKVNSNQKIEMRTYGTIQLFSLAGELRYNYGRNRN